MKKSLKQRMFLFAARSSILVAAASVGVAIAGWSAPAHAQDDLYCEEGGEPYYSESTTDDGHEQICHGTIWRNWAYNEKGEQYCSVYEDISCETRTP